MAVSVLVVASAVVVAVQDEKAEKGKQCITTFSLLGKEAEVVDPLRPQLGFLTGVSCPSGLKSLQF